MHDAVTDPTEGPGRPSADEAVGGHGHAGGADAAADDLAGIESDLDTVDAVLDAIDRGDLDEAEALAATVEDPGYAAGPASDADKDDDTDR